MPVLNSSSSSNNDNNKNNVTCELQRNGSNKSTTSNAFNVIRPLWLQSAPDVKKIKVIMPYVIS